MHCKMSTGLAAQLQRPPRQRATNPWSRCCCICICICILQGLHPPPALTCRALPCPASPRLSAQQPGVFDQISMGISEMGIDTEMRMGGNGVAHGDIEGLHWRHTTMYTPKQVKAGPSSAEPWELLDPFFLRPAPTLPRQHMAWSDICPKDLAYLSDGRCGGGSDLEDGRKP